MTASFTYPPGERTDRYEHQLTAATFATAPARVALTAVPGNPGAWDVAANGQTVGTWYKTPDGAILEDPDCQRAATVCMLAGTSQAVTMGEGAHAEWWSRLAGMVLAGNCVIDGTTGELETEPTPARCRVYGYPGMRCTLAAGHAGNHAD